MRFIRPNLNLGIFQPRSRLGPPPPDDDLWRLASWYAVLAHEGPSGAEPWVAHQLAGLRARLIRVHHEDVPLIQAHEALDQAMLAYRAVTAQERVADTETALRIRAGHAARLQRGDPEASHLRAGGARAQLERKRVRDRLVGTREEAERRNLAFRAVTATLIDRMMVEATAAMPDLQRYLMLLNVLRVHDGHNPLDPLPADLPERLVLETCRQVVVDQQQLRTADPTRGSFDGND